MGRKLKFGEPTKVFRVRLPISKYDKIKERIENLIKPYIMRDIERYIESDEFYEKHKVAIEKGREFDTDMTENRYIENKNVELRTIRNEIINCFYYRYHKEIKDEFIKIAKEIIAFLMDFQFRKQKDKLKVKKPELFKKDKGKILDTIKSKTNQLRKIKYRVMLYFRRHLTDKLPDYTQEGIEFRVKEIINNLNIELEKCNEYKILTI